ncbi:MAG: hypothetical protein ACRCZB_05035 [Bacteroidales bacterium]
MKKETDKMIEEYIEFVQKSIKKFSDIGDLVRGEEVPSDKVFKALASYYHICTTLNSEYQRIKIEKVGAELEYDDIYSEWFQEAKAELVAENTRTTAKPALKEIEQLIKHKHRNDYNLWKIKLASLESKCDFYIRMRETLHRYDSILTNLAVSLRSELRALNIEDRANAREKFAPIR